MELEELPAGEDGVSRVVPALVADDEVGLAGEEVGGLALALVPPLRSDQDRRRHAGILSGNVCGAFRSRGLLVRGAETLEEPQRCQTNPTTNPHARADDVDNA